MPWRSLPHWPSDGARPRRAPLFWPRAKQAARLASHRTYPGGQPSTTILLKRLDPRSLGMLIALYEHKTFVQGIVWGIQSFDQWGVELGKQLAGRVLAALDAGKDDTSLDPSTRALLRAYRRWRDD